MRRVLADGYELDDDPERIDVGVVHRFIAEESYWAPGRTRDVMQRAIAGSARVLGLYAADGRQVGFARVISDGSTMAYLADVFVLPEARGRGRGVELVREAIEGEPHGRCRWILHTADAHELYRRLGFRPGSSERIMERAQTQ